MHVRHPPLTPDLWPGLQDLFGKQGACYGCWRTHFRLPPSGRCDNERERNKEHIRARIAAGPPPGLLAFADDEAVGWMQIGPLTTCRSSTMRAGGRRRSTPPTPAIRASGDFCSLFCVPGCAARHLRTGRSKRGIAFARRAAPVLSRPVRWTQSKSTPRSSGSSSARRRVFEKAGFLPMVERKAGRPLMRYVLEKRRAPSAIRAPASDESRSTTAPEGSAAAMREIPGGSSGGTARRRAPIGDGFEVSGDVVDEGDRPFAPAADHAHGRTLRGFGRDERVGKDSRSSNARRTGLWRCGMALSRTISRRGASEPNVSTAPAAAVCQVSVHRRTRSSAPRRLRPRSPRRPPWRRHCHGCESCREKIEALTVQEANERMDEIEHHLVDIDDQKRPRFARQFGDLPRRLRVVAHADVW